MENGVRVSPKSVVSQTCCGFTPQILIIQSSRKPAGVCPKKGSFLVLLGELNCPRSKAVTQGPAHRQGLTYYTLSSNLQVKGYSEA